MTPSEEHVAFYHEIGISITQWTHVERALYGVLTSVVPEVAHHQLALAFFSVENFRSKLALVDNVFSDEGAMTSRHSEAWAKLVEWLNSAAAMRNKLAHYRVIVFSGGKPGRQYALVAWLIEYPKGKKRLHQLAPPPGALCVRDIIKARYNFFALTMSLQNFAARVAGRPEPFPKDAEQVMRPPKIPEIARQIHVILGHPRESSREKRRKADEANAAASLSIPLPEDQR